ncbi:Dihydrolipoyllysine-residue acetyltransferase component of acetoin cleaving system [Diplogelasinospora grovesii]|uniref:Dihydrolipoyllysine-residue acetyltransferase component of acetoin cleaving system n=1 Tax=Diplogelasinospora grovesii TaxID=303347 RepID=A0AAN6MXV0_9PEZI|nr:Dihydrolipoyllysine-residue acetyltransferase component of acetoin cleaving system [Diplogelasinospora grovesii]
MATAFEVSQSGADMSVSNSPTVAEAVAGEELFFESHNLSAATTIVLLHGLLSSRLEWEYVIPFLTDYHVLAVDLPGHSGSLHIQPSRINAMANRIADLIKRRAHSGDSTDAKAHVVGLSMGGFVALDLARRYPERCLSVFVTGASPFEGLFAWMAGHPRVIYTIMYAIDSLPDEVYNYIARKRGLLPHDELRKEMRASRKWETVSDVYASILELGWAEIEGINQVRTLNIAGGLQDDVESTRRVGKVWRDNGTTQTLGSRAVVVRDAVHAWDLQMPELFAEGIKAWIEGRELPDGFEDLQH